MNKEDLKDMSNSRLLDLLEAFTKAWHYEAVNEFQYLRELDVTYNDVRREVMHRMGSE